MGQIIVWTPKLIEEFKKSSCLTELEEKILDTRIALISRTSACMLLNISSSTYDRAVKKMKIKYDLAQKENPNLPPRKFSQKEVWMDSN